MNELTSTQLRILKILLADTTAKQPITGLNLAKRVGLPDRRRGDQGGDMRLIIHTLRAKGFPICANGRGYFYARHESELSKFILQLQNRIVNTENALKGLKSSFHNVGAVDANAEVGFTKEVAVRTSNGVAYRKFPIGSNGQPIIPAGVEIV